MCSLNFAIRDAARENHIFKRITGCRAKKLIVPISVGGRHNRSWQASLASQCQTCLPTKKSSRQQRDDFFYLIQGDSLANHLESDLLRATAPWFRNA